MAEKNAQPQAYEETQTGSHIDLTNLLTNLGLGFENLYKLDSRLQSGSYGSVFTCTNKLKEQEDSNEKFAVKVITRGRMKEHDLYREVNILKFITEEELHSQRLLQFVDFFASKDNYYLVTEYCPGGDVYDRLAKRVFYNEELARDLSYNLLDAIRALHSVPIAHRDIKPENLLLKSMENDTDIKIADFGFASKVPSCGKFFQSCGTPSFVAPELIHKRGYDHRADMWSVGVTIYILLCGYPPFRGHDSKDLFRKIRSADFKFHQKYWGGVSSEAKELVIGLLQADPSRRLTSEQALNSKWLLKERSNLSQSSLASALSEIKKFNAKRKMKGAVMALRWGINASFWDSERGGQFAKTEYIKTGTTFKDQKTAKSFQELYQLERQIDKGTFATVWKSRVLATDKEVAVKVVDRSNLRLKDDAAVLNEVSILQSLRHPNILQVHDFFEEKEIFYIPMEYLAGGNIFGMIVQRNQFTEKDARDIAKCLLDATKYIHECDIAHRDLKPQNLLIQDPSDNNTLKVADFGFAKRVYAPNCLRTRLGTPTYVAPEVLASKPYDKPCDMWSIGVIIYVLLVGYPPFMYPQRKILYEKIQAGDYEFYEEDWVNISDDAKQLIQCLLNVDAKERWTATQALGCNWFKTEGDILITRGLSKSLSVRKFNIEVETSPVWNTSPKTEIDKANLVNWSKDGS